MAEQLDALARQICSPQNTREAEAQFMMMVEPDPLGALEATQSDEARVLIARITPRAFKKSRGALNQEVLAARTVMDLQSNSSAAMDPAAAGQAADALGSFCEQFLERLYRIVCNVINTPGAARYVVNGLVRALCHCQKLALDESNGATAPIRHEMLNSLRPSLLVGGNDPPQPPPPCFLVRRILADGAPTVPAALLEAPSRILAELTTECGTFDSRAVDFMTFTSHRRASGAYRDGSLTSVFEYATRNLRVADPNGAPMQAVQAVCDLVRTCLTYDFMAIVVDETEDVYVTQYPSDWRPFLVESTDVLLLLRAVHESVPPPAATSLLRAAVSLIGARRSLFDSPEQKVAFLSFMMDFLVSGANSAGDKLMNLEYCGVLAEAIQRFIPPASYSDLQVCPSFRGFIEFVVGFSRTVFALPYGEGTSFLSTTALMTFWQRMVNSKRLQDAQTERDIEAVMPELISTFVRTRVGVPDEQLNDDAVDALPSQTDILYNIFQLELPQNIGVLVNTLQEITAETVTRHPSTIIWFCYIVAALLRSFVPNVQPDTIEPLAALIDFAVRCCTLYHQSAAKGTVGAVELAVVHLLAAMQSVFNGHRGGSTVQTLLERTFGEKTNLFQMVLTSAGPNILSTKLEKKVIEASLDLIIDTCGDMPTSQLVKLTLDVPPTVELPMSQSQELYKLRTKLLHVLYVVRLPDPYGPEQFRQFLAPIEALMNASDANVLQRSPLYVAGWLRDLRGIALSTSCSEGALMEFIDWLVSQDAIFAGLASTPSLPPTVMNSFTKVLLQLVTPARHSPHRLSLTGTGQSPCGMYLMNFITKHLQALLSGLRAPTESMSHEAVYALYLKPITVGMKICTQILAMDFVPFGAMLLYRDQTFDNTVVGIIRLLTAVPMRLMKDYHKVATGLTALLHMLKEKLVWSPFAAMSVDDLRFITSFALAVVGDSETKVAELNNALEFLAFVGSSRRYVDSPAMDPATAIITPRQFHKYVRTVVATNVAAMGVSPEGRTLYDDIADAAMEIVTSQDRCLAPASSAAFAIFDADGAAFERYCNGMLARCSATKARSVTDLLRSLGGELANHPTFFHALVTFRTNMRNLGA